MPRSLVYAPILNSAWSSHTFAPPCANACAVFRPCGLRFAPCPRGSSRFAAFDCALRMLGASSRFAASNGQRPGRECIFTLRTALRFACAAFRVFAQPSPSAGLCSAPADFALLRVLAPPAASRPSTAHFVCSALQPFGPSPFRKRLHPQFAIVDLHRSQARLQFSLLTELSPRCFAHRARASCAPQKIPEMTYTPSFLI